MQLTAMPLWLFGALALGVAGVLVALQFLRIRPRRQLVITTIFWEQAAGQVRASTLYERFRHPRTFLLLLVTSLAVLLALAAPVLRVNDPAFRVIVLEAGPAMMTEDGRFERALALVGAELASTGEERVALITADPQPRVLKHFDESLADLDMRLAELRPTEAPVVRNEVLKVAKSLLEGRGDGEVALVTAQPTVLKDDGVRVIPAAGTAPNAFILAATFVPDAADLTQGSFHCRVGFAGNRRGSFTLRVKRDTTVLFEESIGLNPGESREFVVPKLAADGTTLVADLQGGDLVSADNRVAFRLPDRRRITIAPLEGLDIPPGLLELLKALPEADLGQGENLEPPILRAGPAGSDSEIWIDASEASGEWRLVEASGHPLVSGLAFEDALCRIPSSPSSGVALLLAGGVPVAGLDEEVGRLHVSSSLLDSEGSLMRRTAYPVFWASLLHHLAGWTEAPLTLSPEQADRSSDPTSDAVVLRAAMGDLDFTVGDAATPGDRGRSRAAGWQLLLAFALALMLVEAALNLRGRIT